MSAPQYDVSFCWNPPSEVASNLFKWTPHLKVVPTEDHS